LALPRAEALRFLAGTAELRSDGVTCTGQCNLSRASRVKSQEMSIL